MTNYVYYHLLSDISSVIPVPSTCYQGDFTPKRQHFHFSFRHIPCILSLHECKCNTTLWNFRGFHRIFLQSYSFSPVISLLCLGEFYTQEIQKSLKILGGTSSIIYVVKRCFHFSDFRYGFLVHVTYPWFCRKRGDLGFLPRFNLRFSSEQRSQKGIDLIITRPLIGVKS